MQHSKQFNAGLGQSAPLRKIDDTVKFVRKLLEGYGWEQSERESIEAGLEFVARKRNDKNLNLSVVGEFSSGKSTFINALLRENLLESGNKPTTIAKTIIRHAQKRDVITIFNNGKTKLFSETRERNWFVNLFRSMPELRQHIADLTTDPKSAKRVREVIIEHPAEILKMEIAIIDTPGTNSENWHEKITRGVIRDISDVSVILIDANWPVPESLIDFIKENLSDVLGHCIFVANMMDKVEEEEEREDQLSSFKQRLSVGLNITEPIVLPYTPKLVLGEADEKYRLEKPYTKDDRQKLIEESYNTERAIFQRLVEQRVNIQAQKLSNVLKQSLSNLQSSISVRQERYKKHYAVLEEHRKPNFKIFMKEMENKYLTIFDKERSNTEKQMRVKLWSLADSQIRDLKRQFDHQPDKDDLKLFVIKKIPKILKDNGKSMVKYYHEQIEQYQLHKNLPINARKLIEQFWVEFSKPYSELDPLKVKNVRQKINFKFHFDKEQFKINPFLLNDLFPEFGSGFWDSLESIFNFFTTLKTRKKEVWDQILPRIKKIYGDVIDSITANINQCYETPRQHIQSQLDDCFGAYHKTIESMIARQQEEREQLARYIAQTDADVTEIGKRQGILDELRQLCKD